MLKYKIHVQEEEEDKEDNKVSSNSLKFCWILSTKNYFLILIHENQWTFLFVLKSDFID